MKKRSFALLLALLMLVLAACGGQGDQEQQTTTEATTQGTTQAESTHEAYEGIWYAGGAEKGLRLRISENDDWAMQDGDGNILLTGRLRENDAGGLDLYNVEGELTLVVTLDKETTLYSEVVKEYDGLEFGTIYSSQITISGEGNVDESLGEEDPGASV